MSVCPKCATTLNDDANFCSNCGCAIIKPSTEDPSIPEDIRIYTPSFNKEKKDAKIYIPSNKKKIAVPVDSAISQSDQKNNDSDHSPATLPYNENKNIPVSDCNDSDVKVVESKVKNDETHIWTVAEVAALKKKASEAKKDKEIAEKELQNDKHFNLPSRKQVISAIVALAIILALFIGFSLPEKTNYKYRNTFLMLTHNGNGELKLYKNGQFVSSASTSTTHIDSSAINASGNVVAAITRSDTDNGSLYYSDGKKLHFVSDNVYKMEMAADSGNLVYLTKSENGYDLYLYDGRNNLLIDHGVADNFCISPDGRNVGYIKSSNSEDDYTGYIYGNGTSSALGPDMIPFAIADNNAYIYYFLIEGNNKPFYVKKGTVDSVPVKLAAAPDSIFFNCTLSEVVFTDNNVTYLSEKGSDKSIISQNADAQILLPYGCTIVEVQGWFADAHIYSTSSFRKGYIICSDALYYLPKKSKATKVVSSYDQIYLSNDGNTVFYLKNGDIRSIDGRTPNVPPSVLAANANSFTISADGKYVYFISDDYELMCKTGTDNPVLLSESPDISNLYSRHIFDSNKLVYFVGNNIFIAAGSKINMVSSEMDYISSVSANGLCIFIHGLKGGENVYYLSGDGKKYQQY